MEIYKKLLEIQKSVKGLEKDKQGFGFKYVSGDKLLGFVRPLMDEKGLLLKQEVLSIDNVRIDYKTKNGEKSEYNSKVMMRFTWVDVNTGQKDENLFGTNGQNDWDKGVGSALTYAERYFILKYFHIATDEDDIDNPALKPEEPELTKTKKVEPEKTKPKPKAKSEVLTEEHMTWFRSGKGVTIEKLEKALKLKKITAKQKEELENLLTVAKNK